jgi:hypothetical protein
MAFVDAIGTVDCLQVGDDYGFVAITEAGGVKETLILWYGPSEPSAFTRVMHSMWLSMLREAMAAGTLVNLRHESGSAFVTFVQVNKP